MPTNAPTIITSDRGAFQTCFTVTCPSASAARSG